MDIFNILSLIGGLALFLFGMNLMGESLEKRAGNQLKNILEKLTASRWKGFLLGAGVTAIIQSSSATTVMVVGFVNSGIMNLNQAIGIIMGANVGTTITSWVLSLTGIESSNIWISLLKPKSFTPILALIGIVLIMRKKNSKGADTGMVLLGFSVLMYGMEAMSAAVSPLKDVPEFQNILVMFENPILGVLAGALLTGIVQSSSASVGILQALASTGTLRYGGVIPIVMGQNIGTCVTAMISSVGTNKNAKRTAVVHLCFNVIGTLVWLTVFCVVNSFGHFRLIYESASEFGIAIIHTVFNVLCTLLLFPFANQLEKLACFIVKDSKGKESLQLLDERLMATPTIAIEYCKNVSISMLNKSVTGVKEACATLKKFNSKALESIIEKGGEVNNYEDKLGTYLVKVSGYSLREQDGQKVSGLLYILGDIERISTHAIGIAKSAEKMNNKKLKFSDSAAEEMDVMIEAVDEIMEQVTVALRDKDETAALKVGALEVVVGHLQNELKHRHIDRLKEGKCTIEQGVIMLDIITALKRISDHCSNIAGCVAKITNESLESHSYTNQREKALGNTFQMVYEEKMQKYKLK